MIGIRTIRDKIQDKWTEFFIDNRIHSLMRPYETIIPAHLAIETTNICNASCVFCPSPAQTRKKGTMDMELFKKIIEDAKSLNCVDVITHGGMGEPLCDKNISKRIEFEKKAIQPVVQLHTNGELLNEETIYRLFDSGLDVLSISLNAYYPGIYKKLTGLNYQRIKNNTERALAIKREKGYETDIRITMVRRKETEQEEVEDFTNYWRSFTPHVAVHPVKNWKDFSENTLRGKSTPCKWIWRTLSIKWDGKVSVCHEDYDNKAVIGNLNRERIVDVFNCDTLKEIRNSFYEGQTPPADLCGDCSRVYLDKIFWLKTKVIRFPDGMVKYS
jgi:wyosine [tRNA(Phe)-imidazoG37] synthetase (radical SAM superfamily)